jgi:hypothetical protein
VIHSKLQPEQRGRTVRENHPNGALDRTRTQPGFDAIDSTPIAESFGFAVHRGSRRFFTMAICHPRDLRGS